MPTLTPQDFVSKWKRVTPREKQTYHEHFIELCRLARHQMPNDYDPLAHAFGLRWLQQRPAANRADVAKFGRFGRKYN